MIDWRNPCIICGQALAPAVDVGDQVGQPYAGTAFLTSGHYGSTVFDPMSDHRQLRIIVCDGCLVHAAEQGRVLFELIMPRTPDIDQKPWDGQEQ